ncbi:MAG: arsenate reductase/protein-tyrosine-phosphatase family protein [Acidimicrobiales bacterium]
MRILALCTGNVARSVMLAYMLSDLAEAEGRSWRVRSAGTHVAAGQAMSARTRSALEKVPELGEHRYGAHRSHQVCAADLDWADVVLAAELDHVRYVERLIGDRSRAVQLGAFVAYAPAGFDLAEQLGEVARHSADASLDVRDPAGGEQADYDSCASELWRLARRFAELVD